MYFMSRQTLSEAIKERRKYLGMTQAGVARLSNMSLKTYQRIERGQIDIRLSQYNSILKALEVDDHEHGFSWNKDEELEHVTRSLPANIRGVVKRFVIDLHRELTNE